MMCLVRTSGYGLFVDRETIRWDNMEWKKSGGKAIVVASIYHHMHWEDLSSSTSSSFLGSGGIMTSVLLLAIEHEKILDWFYWRIAYCSSATTSYRKWIRAAVYEKKSVKSWSMKCRETEWPLRLEGEIRHNNGLLRLYPNTAATQQCERGNNSGEYSAFCRVCCYKGKKRKMGEWRREREQ